MHHYETHAMSHIRRARAVWIDITQDFSSLFMFGSDIHKPMMGAVYYGPPLRVVTQRLTTEAGYLAAMHEVGHINSGHTELTKELQGPWNPEYRRRIVGLEAEAWHWAFTNALPVSDSTVELAVQAFKSYIRDFGWGEWTPADLPDVMAAHFDREAVAA